MMHRGKYDMSRFHNSLLVLFWATQSAQSAIVLDAMLDTIGQNDSPDTRGSL